MDNILLDKESIKYSKQYLIKGWGLEQQEKVANLRVHFPEEWYLFKAYLIGLGNIAKPEGPYNIIIRADNVASEDINAEYSLRSVINDRMKITLESKDSMPIKEWKFFKPSHRQLSTEYIQMAYFQALTDSIKGNLV
jgi:hypothetical protein